MCSCKITFFIIMRNYEYLSDNEKEEIEPRVSITLQHGSGFSVREISLGEDEGGAQEREDLAL